ncbi:POM121-like protein 12 [Oryctolagus cuniculus]|uniref:POM121-like protein 12 n=1 Tax=Oryctolagus cuniculus TaxID=9986 RepID=UPI003879452A
MGFYLNRFLNSYLANPDTKPSASAQEHPAPGPRSGHNRQATEASKVSQVQRERQARIAPLPTAAASLEHAPVQRATLPEASRLLPSRPRQALAGLDPTSGRLSRTKRRLGKAQNPAAPRSQVTMQIAAPQRPGSLYRCARAQEGPDPCARDTVLRALGQCSKGRRKFDGPLWLESPEPKRQRQRQSPSPKLSAFVPVTRNGVILAFMPRPGGHLHRGARSRPAEGHRRRRAAEASRAASAQPPQPAARPAAGTSPCSQGLPHRAGSSCATARGSPPQRRPSATEHAWPAGTPAPERVGALGPQPQLFGARSPQLASSCCSQVCPNPQASLLSLGGLAPRTAQGDTPAFPGPRTPASSV